MQLSKNHRYTRFSVKLNKCENSINNHSEFLNDPFIYLAHVLDLSIWTIITWTVVMRSSCSNKFSHKSTEMNAFCIFQISDCILFTLCFPVSEGNCGSGLERTSISMKNIYFNIILWYTSILNDNWAVNFARPF